MLTENSFSVMMYDEAGKLDQHNGSNKNDTTMNTFVMMSNNLEVNKVADLVIYHKRETE